MGDKVTISRPIPPDKKIGGLTVLHLGGILKTIVANYAQDKLKMEIAGNTTRHYSTLCSRKDRLQSECGFSP